MRMVTGLSGLHYRVGDIWNVAGGSHGTSLPEIAGISDVPVRVAMARGIAAEDLPRYFTPRVADWMVDPSGLVDMDAGAAMLADAIQDDRRIGIVGDYDVDGATSIAVIGNYLSDLGVTNWCYHVPQRLTDGYGVTPKAIDHLYRQGCSTILVLDSGTLAFPAMEYARLMGINLVIIDHHEPGPGWRAPSSPDFGEGQPPLVLDAAGVTIPAVERVERVGSVARIDWRQPAAVTTEVTCIINPKREDDHSGLDSLCTAGLTILLCVKINAILRARGIEAGSLPQIMDYMGLAALGTVADLMPLEGLNRAYVAAGLARMHIMPGVAGLAMAARGVADSEEFPVLKSYDLGFLLGPAVNAAGRIDDCEMGAAVLLARTLDEAVAGGRVLVEINVKRKDIQRQVEDEAMAEAAAIMRPDDRCVVVANESWHPGVIGIVAGRLRERYNLPAVVIGEGGKGSGRSGHGFDLGGAFHDAVAAGILSKGGGHKAAGGLTLAAGRGEDFRRFMLERTAGLAITPERIDGVLPADRINAALVMGIEAMEPFGMGNPKPVWLLEDVVITGARWVGQQKDHLSLFIQPAGDRIRFSAVVFGAKGGPLERLETMIGATVSLVVEISRDRRSTGGIPDASIVVRDAIGDGEEGDELPAHPV